MPTFQQLLVVIVIAELGE